MRWNCRGAKKVPVKSRTSDESNQETRKITPATMEKTRNDARKTFRTNRKPTPGDPTRTKRVREGEEIEGERCKKEEKEEEEGENREREGGVKDNSNNNNKNYASGNKKIGGEG